jgi:hypothetical protein
LSHISNPFALLYFSGMVSCILPRPALDQDSPTSASLLAGIVGMHHQANVNAFVNSLPNYLYNQVLLHISSFYFSH